MTTSETVARLALSMPLPAQELNNVTSNHERLHRGRGINARTPVQVFLESRSEPVTEPKAPKNKLGHQSVAARMSTKERHRQGIALVLRPAAQQATRRGSQSVLLGRSGPNG